MKLSPKKKKQSLVIKSDLRDFFGDFIFLFKSESIYLSLFNTLVINDLINYLFDPTGIFMKKKNF